MEDKQLPDRVDTITRTFYKLLPMVLSTIGLVFLLALLVIPDLRKPEFIGAYTGLLVVVGTSAIARRESK